MSLLDFIRLIRNNLKLLVFLPLLMGGITYYFTRNLDREYLSSTMLYTGLATGFNIESTGEGRKDQFVVNNSFENLINTIRSRETLKEVSFRLLARHLTLDQADGRTIGTKAFSQLQDMIPEPVRQLLVVPGNPQATYQRLVRAYESNQPKHIHDLINEGNSLYSLKRLSEIKPVRKGNSDMIEISYSATDRAIAQHTLSLTVDVFMQRYKGLKASETGSVVTYFENQLTTAKNDLNQAEERMQSFRDQGQIMNYNEQTKAVAYKKEDITDEHHRLVGELEATDNALAKLEEKLSVDRYSFFRNNELLKQKEKLVDVTTAIARNSISPNGKDMSFLNYEAKRQERQLSDGIRSLYERTHSTENVQVQALLDSWLENMISYEKNKARVKMLNVRLSEVKQDYSRFVPLGSGMARLEREIDVRERAYIQILHDLNQALLRKQNIEISSNLNVVDKPITVEQPSKKSLLVILSALIGIVGLLVTLITLELMDKTLKTPERATEFTALPVAGALPIIDKKHSKRYQLLHETLIGQIITRCRMHLGVKMATGIPSSATILIASTQPGEGKTLVMERLARKLTDSGAKVMMVRADEPTGDLTIAEQFTYAKNAQLAEARTLSELVQEPVNPFWYDYILIETPALLSGNLPLNVLRRANMALLVVQASRSWKPSDNKALEVLKSFNFPIEMVVNGVTTESLENLVADIQRPDTGLKSWLKRLFRFELNRKELTVAA